jgi:DNA polymerase elongation subunit (family B)
MNELLYGHNPLEHVVAVHQLNDSTIRIYRRENGKVSHNDAEFFPFFFLASERYLEGYTKKIWLKKLDGSNYYRYLAAFPRWSEMWEAVRHALREYKKTTLSHAEHYTEAQVIHLRPDPVAQFLMQSGTTYFKNMRFEDLYRVQFDIETYSKDYRFSNARKTEDRIILITLSDNLGWEEVIDGRKATEPEMLRKFTRLIQEKDPDVIESHNLFGFDLPYILQRCELHNLEFRIGRDESQPRAVSMRPGTTGHDGEVQYYDLNGRNLVDTLLLAQTYDMTARVLEGYGLKYLAQHFGFASKHRTYIPGTRISWYWDNEPEVLIAYALDDVRETRMLAEHLSPSYFYLSQIVPLPYTTITRAGSTVKIESLLLREYLRRRHSVPKPTPGDPTSGGYSDIFVTGVLSDVVHADVESLYPSIIVSKDIAPRYDTLRIFPTLLKKLLAMRLKAKKQMLRSTQALTRSKHDAIQSSYKILINSFYGYLGYGNGLFSDFEQADVVTSTGRELLREIIKQVELYNGTVIEVDTDGLYFLPPDNVRGREQEQAFVQRLSATLPAGLTLAYTAHYKKMLSYKKKNYALLTEDEKFIIKGSSLTSRSMERFLRRYVRECIACLLREDFHGLHQLYVSYAQRIRSHAIDVYDFCRTETLRDSLERYAAELAAGTRKPSPAYEAIKRAGLYVRPGQSVSYYVTGSQAGLKIVDNTKLADEWDPNFPDENTAYYLSRLDDASSKFALFFRPEDFKKIFSTDDLFGFSAEGITLLIRTVHPEEVVAHRAEEEEAGDFAIWLDSEKAQE